IQNSQLTHGYESLHVLIVDDDPINLQVLENQLRIEKYAITRANNGQEALDAVNSGTSFAIILLDIMMPKMSGFEVCRIIRETHPPNLLPIIMLTANNQVSDLVEGMQSGANDYLTPPFSKGELITRIRTHVQLSLVNIAYSNFVPLEFLKLLEKDSIVDVRLGDHVQKKMTVLFADIRSFTTLSESMSPKENFEFINDYLGRVSPIIRKYNGFIDKYIGDAIMALFPEKVNDAVQASIEIHRQLILFNQERKQQSKQQINIGIGLHIGSLMLGTIGETKRMEGTVISDAVNLASRLEGLTKLYGASTLISGEVLDGLPNLEQYNYRFLGKVRVKGKQAPVKVLEIIDSESNKIRDKKIALKPQFEQAIVAYYDKQFEQAIEYFQDILSELPQDKAAIFYLERCKHYFEKGPPTGWEGIEALDKK
ncbi:response regulator, partial [Thiotrichales bacterium HSG1]|nr:response regulator [Thiotrichales bacterium HSG1]